MYKRGSNQYKMVEAEEVSTVSFSAIVIAFLLIMSVAPVAEPIREIYIQLAGKVF